MRPGDKDEGLGDDSNLEVDDHVDLGVVGRLVIIHSLLVMSINTKLVLEEAGLEDDDKEGNAIQKASAPEITYQKDTKRTWT